MFQHLIVQVRIGGQEVLHRQVVASPGVVSEVALFARKEAVIRQQSTSVAGRQDDLVPFAFLATPVLQGTVLGVVDQSQPYGVLGLDVRMQTARIGGSLLRMEAENAADGRADAIGADDQIVADGLTVSEGNDTRLQIDVFALLLLAFCPLLSTSHDRCMQT